MMTGTSSTRFFPRLLAAQGAISRRVPAPHSGATACGLPKANLDQPIKRLTLVLSSERMRVLLLREQGRRAFEQPDIVLLDLAQMRQQGSRQNRRDP